MPMALEEVASVIKKYNNVNLKRKPSHHERVTVGVILQDL